jgi:hypothetical protein
MKDDIVQNRTLFKVTGNLWKLTSTAMQFISSQPGLLLARLRFLPFENSHGEDFWQEMHQTE